jgi:hypothetical protein
MGQMDSHMPAVKTWNNYPLQLSGGSAASTFRNPTCRQSMNGGILSQKHALSEDAIPYVTNNPYSNEVSKVDAFPDSSEERSPTVDFAPILRRWERLRIVYNVTLIGIVLAFTLLAFPFLIGSVPFWVRVIFGAIIANTCYFIAPAIEGYGRQFRVWNSAFSILLFLAGLAFTSLLAILCILSYADMFQ